ATLDLCFSIEGISMKSVEISGRTVAEAVEQALAQLRKDRDDVVIEVVRQDASSALVRISVPDDEELPALELEEQEEPEQAELEQPLPPRVPRPTLPIGDIALM